VEQEVSRTGGLEFQPVETVSQIVGDETTAVDSVLRADVWRESLLKEESSLNAKLSELESEGDDKRFENAREEAASRLTEVHQRLADMDAESGPARAASLLAGRLCFDYMQFMGNCRGNSHAF
jgi:ATPase subunit of ABC transporter with duplicated ATPase domains